MYTTTAFHQYEQHSKPLDLHLDHGRAVGIDARGACSCSRQIVYAARFACGRACGTDSACRSSGAVLCHTLVAFSTGLRLGGWRHQGGWQNAWLGTEGARLPPACNWVGGVTRTLRGEGERSNTKG
jgi:hypothetical protein